VSCEFWDLTDLAVAMLNNTGCRKSLCTHS
jgi:hypothetical protein